MAEKGTAPLGGRCRQVGLNRGKSDESDHIGIPIDINRTPSAPVALTWIPLGSAVERVFARLAEKAEEAAR